MTALSLQPSTSAVYWFVMNVAHEQHRDLQSSPICSAPCLLPSHPLCYLSFPPSLFFLQAGTKAAVCPMVRRAGFLWETSSRSLMSMWGGETSGSATGSSRPRPSFPTARTGPLISLCRPTMFTVFSFFLKDHTCKCCTKTILSFGFFLTRSKCCFLAQRKRKIKTIIALLILLECVCLLKDDTKCTLYVCIQPPSLRNHK